MIPILFETTQLFVLNKPAGMNVERSPHGYPSVEAWVEDHQRERGIGQPYTGIVHRLDRPVSGALIVAKKKSALKKLNAQFREGRVEKTYLAIVEKRPGAETGSLRHWIEKDQQAKRAVAYVHPHSCAVEARLHYRLLGTAVDGSALLSVHPLTGKFHQIRVQLADMGCPILGDEKYGAALPYLPDAIALHAWQIGFDDPQSGERLIIRAPAPENPWWSPWAAAITAVPHQE